MRWGAATVLDLGSNTGEAARIAVEAGASHVVGLEKDWASADISFVEAAKSGLPILPLVMDLTNPSPAQGWHNKEWSNLGDRNRSDAVYSLAILHHLVLAEGIPMEHAIAWICGLGRRGIIEFVSPEDPMVIAIRDRIVNPAIKYSKEYFLAQLSRHASVVGERSLTETGRCIFAYEVK
jgi:SAM-dependent methyltransferase